MTPENEALYAELIEEARAGLEELESRGRIMLDHDIKRPHWCPTCRGFNDTPASPCYVDPEE